MYEYIEMNFNIKNTITTTAREFKENELNALESYSRKIELDEHLVILCDINELENAVSDKLSLGKTLVLMKNKNAKYLIIYC